MDEESEEEDDDDDSAGRERKQSSTPSAEDASPAFEIAASPLTGGLGLFAIRPISQGSIILSEAPLFTQPPLPRRSNSTIMSRLAQCTRDEQCQFFTLWNAHKTPRPGQSTLLPALGIFETNALPCGVFPGRTGAQAEEDEEVEKVQTGGHRDGIFLQASRINHSCIPNMARSWDAETQEMVFRAIRDIEVDEELCISYIGVDVLKRRAQRKADIEKAFGFTCTCEACSLEGEELAESDQRRAAVKRVYEEIGKCGKEPTLGLRKVSMHIPRFGLSLIPERDRIVHRSSSQFGCCKKRIWCTWCRLSASMPSSFVLWWVPPQASHRCMRINFACSTGLRLRQRQGVGPKGLGVVLRDGRPRQSLRAHVQDVLGQPSGAPARRRASPHDALWPGLTSPSPLQLTFFIGSWGRSSEFTLHVSLFAKFSFMFLCCRRWPVGNLSYRISYTD